MDATKYFSPTAKQVHAAIIAVNPQDEDGIGRFAERAAKAADRLEAGLHFGNRPPLTVLLHTWSESAPLTEAAYALGEGFIGTSDNIPLTFIDCGGYTSEFPAILNDLIVPLWDGQRYVTPKLAPDSLERPHRLLKTDSELRPMFSWWDRFTEKNSTTFSLQDQFIQNIWMPIYHKFDRERQRVFANHAPYRSVVVFHRIEQASGQFISKILLPIITEGILRMEGNDNFPPMHFNNTIVILTMEDDPKELKEMALGFLAGREEKEDRRKLWQKTCERLYEHYKLRALVQKLGVSNVIIIAPRTQETQRKKLEGHFLKNLREKLDPLNIQVRVEPEVIELIIRESEDSHERTKANMGFTPSQSPTEEIYYDSRLRFYVAKHLLDPLAEYFLKGELKSNSVISFTKTSEGVAVKTISVGENAQAIERDALKTTEAQNAKLTSAEPAEMSNFLKQLDEEARAAVAQIQDQRKALEQQIRGAIVQQGVQLMLTLIAQKGFPPEPLEQVANAVLAKMQQEQQKPHLFMPGQ